MVIRGRGWAVGLSVHHPNLTTNTIHFQGGYDDEDDDYTYRNIINI